MKFSIDGESDTILIASTRPELLCACRTVIVADDDERYKNLVGKYAITPIFGDRVEIKTHHSVDKEFGTGAVKLMVIKTTWQSASMNLDSLHRKRKDDASGWRVCKSSYH